MNTVRFLNLELRMGLSFSALCCLPLALKAQDSNSNMQIASPSVHLDPFEVTGTRQQAQDYTTLKANTKVIETPRSLTVIDSSRIREQDFQAAGDLLFWVPGINSNGDSYHFYARGFRMLPNDWKVDGFTGRVIEGSYTPNLFGVEAVSFLKGPAGLLYGATSSPGGQITLTTKKPSELPSTTVELRVNSFDGGDTYLGEHAGTKLSLDSTGPLTQDARLSYRLLSSNEKALSVPTAGDTTQFYRLSVAAKLDTAGKYKLIPSVEWSRENRETRGPFISPSSSLSTTDNRSDYTLADLSNRDLNLAAGHRVDDNLTVGTDFTGALSEAWSINASLRYLERDYLLNSWAVQTATLKQEIASDPLSWTVKRRHTRARSESSNLSFDVNTSYEANLAPTLKNTTLLGLNARRSDAYSYTGTSGADQSAINLYTGKASAALIEDASSVLRFASATRTYAWNAYLQNRTTWRETWLFSLSTGLTGDKVNSGASTTRRQSDVKPNASLVYMLSPKAALYASYSTSYNLPTATYEDLSGKTGNFSPIEGESFELGAKAEFLKDLVAASVSIFDTALNNTLVQSQSNELNSNGNQYYSQLDAGRKSRGVELEFTVTPLKGWDTTATYAYIDAYDRKADGSRSFTAELTPRNALSLYSRYAFLKGKQSGWALRGGIIWQGERLGASGATSTATLNKRTDPLLLSAFHRFDAGISYRYKGWSFALNVENLTNELYLVTGSTGLNLNPSKPRGYALRVAHTW